jgi:hypothetical protein
MNQKVFIAVLVIVFNIMHLAAQNTAAHAIITGKDGTGGLVGVNILLKGTVHGTVSGIHGDYILQDIPAGKHTLLCSYIGFETCEVDLEFLIFPW